MCCKISKQRIGFTGFLVLLAAILCPVAGQAAVSLQFTEIQVSAVSTDSSVKKADLVSPGGSIAVTVSGKFSRAPAKGETVTLNFISDLAYWKNASLPLFSFSKASGIAVFKKTLNAPTQIGLHTLVWQPSSSKDGNFGGVIKNNIEVSCSDGVFANGVERYVRGKCVKMPAGFDPCDDGYECSHAQTDPNRDGYCLHTLDPECQVCTAKQCIPHCAKNQECGSDGCNATGCGTCSGVKNTCVAGACVDPTTIVGGGTCASPIPIDSQAVPSGVTQHLTGDTTDGLSILRPACNENTAREKTFIFTVPATSSGWGFDARSYGFDTVLNLRKSSVAGPDLASCLSSGDTPGYCSDDATPPGNLGSRITRVLSAGTYYLTVDGFSTSVYGPFNLDVTFFADGCSPSCEGKLCGPSACTDSSTGQPFQCGPACGADQKCSSTLNQCVASPCIPDCKGRSCGTNGCDVDDPLFGYCGKDPKGECPDGQLCVRETGKCKQFSACNHLLPVCTQNCGQNQYCGTDCECHKVTDPQPDLFLGDRWTRNNEIVYEERYFPESSCAVAEECASPGNRKLVRFPVEAVNQGLTSFAPPEPASRPDLFEFHQCHNHYHFKGFAAYELIDEDGRTVLRGGKRSYCIEDTYIYYKLQGPQAPCDSVSDCDHQGMQSNWVDLYANDLDCQWLDVTGVSPGFYTIRVTTNLSRFFNETTFDNNTNSVKIELLSGANGEISGVRVLP